MLNFKGGIKPDAHKYTKNIPVADALSPAYVRIFTHGDVPCVMTGDIVSIGQPITKNFRAHASICGMVTEIANSHIVIKANGDNSIFTGSYPFNKRLSAAKYEDILNFIRIKGICFGGEFLADKIEKACDKAKILIISCGETAPFLCSKYKTFSDKKKEIIYGMKIIMKALGLSKAAVTAEASYLKEIRDFKKALGNNSGIDVFSHTSKYPADHPTIIKREFLKKYVSKNSYIKEQNILVLSCEEVAAVFHSFKTGLPMISRYVTVDGDAVYGPKTMNVAIGAPVEYLLDLCETENDSVENIVCGNPLAGESISINYSVRKDTSAVLLLGNKLSAKKKTIDCISCGRCHKVCPMGLYPNLLLKNELKNQNCIGCGSCTYICPANIDFSSLNNEEEFV